MWLLSPKSGLRRYFKDQVQGCLEDMSMYVTCVVCVCVFFLSLPCVKLKVISSWTHRSSFGCIQDVYTYFAPAPKVKY